MLGKLLHRWIGPPFFVCEWHTVGNTRPRMAGEFACIGDTRETAESDASQAIERHLQPGMSAIATLRRANLVERITAAPVFRRPPASAAGDTEKG